ncbi:MAG TPA: hypothetical protein VJK09_02315 [Candidatus Paceibacterota bacterium]
MNNVKKLSKGNYPKEVAKVSTVAVWDRIEQLFVDQSGIDILKQLGPMPNDEYEYYENLSDMSQKLK